MLGFIGLGHMGSSMATRLLQLGYPVGVYNRTAEKTRPLADLGARVYSAPAHLAREADVVLTMLTDDAAVEGVIMGPDGVLAAAHRGLALVDLSSVYPETSRRVANAATLRDVATLDAPVSGSTPQAAEGSLIMFVGGEQSVFERCRPVLDVLAADSFYMGPSGSGATMKLVVNALLGAGMQALAEALALGERAGLRKEQLVDVLERTSVLTPGYKHKLQNVLSGTYPVEFALALMWKDFGNVLRLAQEHNVPMPVTAVAQQMCTIEEAKAHDEDFSAVIRTMQDLSASTSDADAPESIR